jgi:hypothetical protein
MAVVHDVDFSQTSLLADQSFVRELVSESFWKWYFQNLSLKITTIKVWIIRKDIYVADLYSLFVLLFGNPKQ